LVGTPARHRVLLNLTMRNKRLDILRCAAVILVLGRHGVMEGVWKETGWAGVDLFFVLSGFLISGLLFSEYKKKESIDLLRFFIRRGFKIYPAFYLMLLTTFVVAASYGVYVAPGVWLREILFFQNYKHGIWRHTWTLAVEEHFYLLLPLFLLALIRLSKNRSNPFRSIPYVYGALATVILAMRYATANQQGFRFEDAPKVLFPTHMRIDALFFGVVLGYLHHFQPEFIPNLLKSRKNRLFIQAATAICLSCILATYEESRFMLSFGLTLVQLGFGGVLVLSLYAQLPTTATFWSALGRRVGNAFAYVGEYSYSIYLWHVAIVAHALGVIVAVVPVHLGPTVQTVVYVALSIGVGILMTRIVEFPALALRNRLFPSAAGAATEVQPTEMPAAAHLAPRFGN
jgi:peptidoglycan/LPS O-acetylase OafA/YrhL